MSKGIFFAKTLTISISPITNMRAANPIKTNPRFFNMFTSLVYPFILVEFDEGNTFSMTVSTGINLKFTKSITV
jgi:hypothetical protein